MTKITKPIPIDDLIEEVVASVNQLILAREDYQKDCLTIFHTLGMNICGHPAYQKGKHGQAEFFEHLAQAVAEKRGNRGGISSSYLHYAAQFYGKFPELSNALETLRERGIPLSIRGVTLQLLPCRKEEQEKSLPKGKYAILYADPPWDIGSMVLEKWESPLEDKYPTLKLEELKAMAGKIEELCADDCVCFMWSTLSTVPWALELLESWGFKYHITLTWDKGGGWSSCGFHRRTELVLVGYRGKLTEVIKQEGNYIPTVFEEKKTEHSRKPQKMYRFLEERTVGPKIELFARRKRKGFKSWGNEV